uniref:Uncharacterized protein n=1 Tax=Meloidogyne enterolobii TaxID=390850 RepID=A0A6V7ULM5_MELEN|nr:unnamed protein product [Meloidogyne enterolobii]
MWLVLFDAHPEPPPCDKYDNPCPPGYRCEDDKCVKTPTTTTTKKPTPPKPS